MKGTGASAVHSDFLSFAVKLAESRNVNISSPDSCIQAKELNKLTPRQPRRTACIADETGNLTTFLAHDATIMVDHFAASFNASRGRLADVLLKGRSSMGAD